VRARLRRPGEWFCADVEMVLSAHAHSLRTARDRQDARPAERLTGSSALQ
jgi:hypothetical protein